MSVYWYIYDNSKNINIFLEFTNIYFSLYELHNV